jgi:predicted transcriptional regulator
MLEKNITTESVREIEFNWERVKKKATDKRDKLVNNNPNIFKRTSAPSNQNTSPGRTSTTDIIIDPYTSIAANTTNEGPNKPPGETKHINTNTLWQQSEPNNNIDSTNTSPTGTHTPNTGTTGTTSPSLLPLPPPQQGITPSCEESLGPERNAVELLQRIKEKQITGKDLTTDERRLVVQSMKELGQTQDAIAQLLSVSRRTIVSDYKVLRQEQALAIQHTDTHEIAGEVYAVAKTCIRRALQAGHFKTVSVIMRDMVEVLQSLGVVYRAPKTSMQASLHGSIPGASHGYHTYMGRIGEDKNKVIDVLDCMFNAIEQDAL